MMLFADIMRPKASNLITPAHNTYWQCYLR